MHKVDAPGATAGNLFTNGDPTNGIPATRLEEDWHNAVQTEIVNVIEGAGIALVKGTNDQMLEAIKYFSTPIGSIIAVDKDMAGTPVIPSNYLIASGSLVSDPDSPYNGKRVRNLNGETIGGIPVIGVNNADKYLEVDLADISAFGVGDSITIPGLSLTNGVVKYLNYALGRVYIGDSTLWSSDQYGTTTQNLTGALSCSIVGTKRFLRGGLISNNSNVNQLQGFGFEAFYSSGIQTGGSAQLTHFNPSNGLLLISHQTPLPVTDGVNGTPRTGAKTQPDLQDIVFYIKIKY